MTGLKVTGSIITLLAVEIIVESGLWRLYGTS